MLNREESNIKLSYNAFDTRLTLLDFFIYFKTFAGNDYVMRDVSYIEFMSKNDTCMCMGPLVYFKIVRRIWRGAGLDEFESRNTPVQVTSTAINLFKKIVSTFCCVHVEFEDYCSMHY